MMQADPFLGSWGHPGIQLETAWLEVHLDINPLLPLLRVNTHLCLGTRGLDEGFMTGCVWDSSLNLSSCPHCLRSFQSPHAQANSTGCLGWGPATSLNPSMIPTCCPGREPLVIVLGVHTLGTINPHTCERGPTKEVSHTFTA